MCTQEKRPLQGKYGYEVNFIPDFFQIIKIKAGASNLLKFCNKVRKTRYKINITKAIISDLPSNLRNYVILLCIDSPITPETCFPDGSVRYVLDHITISDNVNSISKGDMDVLSEREINFARYGPHFCLFGIKSSGEMIYDLNITIIMAFKEITEL